MKRVWKIRETNDSLIDQLSQQTGLSPLLTRVLHLRGFSSPNEIRTHLVPASFTIPDPFAFNEMQVAVDRIVQAVRNQERVLVHGDYDVDGITATAILLETLAKLGMPADFYLPDRLAEGYGLQPEAIPEFARKYDLLITVDCGTTSYEAIESAHRLGLDMIITDHHDPGDRRPDALAVLNPIRPGENYPSKCLSGAGVAWKLAIALQETMLKAYDPKAQLDLVALGMVADIVPLLGENRALLIQAFDHFRHFKRPGLSALMDIARISPAKISTHAIGFQLAPRINASGRMDHPSYALKLLMTQDADEALSLARHLDRLNAKRRQVEERITKEACALVEEQRLHERSPYLLVITGADWHRGVLGIIASRLMQRFHKSVFLLNLEGDIAYGSARTIEGANLIPLLNDARPHAIACGGHADAAGMKVYAHQLPKFEQALYESAQRNWNRLEDTPLWLDAQLALEQIGDDLMHELAQLHPHGKGNEEPTFYARGALNGSGARIVGNNHLRLSLKHTRGHLTCIGFNQGSKMETLTGSEVELAFKCRYNEYQGRREVNLQFLDIRCLENTIHVNTPDPNSSLRPTRSRLGVIYKLMLNAANEENQLPRDFAYMLGHQKNISKPEFENAIHIFSEIGLLQFDDGKITLTNVKDPRDLDDSPTFRRLGGIKNA